jgi:flagellar biosynthetic protein FliP
VKIVRVLAFVLAMVVSLTARAQDMVGPPMPASNSPTTSPAVMSLSDSAGGINPLELLDQAGRALPSRDGSAAGPGISPLVSVLVLLTVVSLAPALMLMTTCFVRIVVVLGLLKQAMGTQTIPPPQVTTGLALFMTMMVMAPTVDRLYTEAVVPYQQGQVQNYDELWAKAKQPIRDFMFAQIETTGNWSSLYMVLEYRGVDTSEPEKLSRNDVDMVTLVPAYMLSELKTAFVMGFRIYLPFLVIDMVVSSILISMSMMMLPPVIVSLPFKLLLFVLVDGWTLIVGNLMRSFEQPAATKAAMLFEPIVTRAAAILT